MLVSNAAIWSGRAHLRCAGGELLARVVGSPAERADAVDRATRHRVTGGRALDRLHWRLLPSDARRRRRASLTLVYLYYTCTRTVLN